LFVTNFNFISRSPEKNLVKKGPIPVKTNSMSQPFTWSSNLVWNAPGAVWNGSTNVSNPTKPMTNDNKISASLTAQDMTDMMAAFAVIKAKLPFLINLTAAEKRRMPNISTERGGMVDTFTIEMGLHPDLVPTYVDTSELAKDAALLAQLETLRACANELCAGINDTHQAVGSDMYLAYLSFYNNVKQAAKRAVVGADAVFANLRRFFQRGGGDTPPPAPTP
jgi:hypothetical protein